MSHRIEFSPETLGDLIDLYDYIAVRDVRRDDLRRGLRILGFERRAVIAFLVTADAVTILRILYSGRDLETIFP